MKNANATDQAVLNDSTRAIIMNHLNSFRDNNLDALIADYNSRSVLVTQDATYTGTEEIRQFFTGMMQHFPKGKSNFELDKLEVSNDLAYITWHAATPSLEVSLATDTFIIKAGKISQQTFAGQIKVLQ